MSAIFIGQSLADDVIPAPQEVVTTETPAPEPTPSSPVESPTPSEEPTPTPEPSPSESSSASADPDPTPSPSPTPTKEPPHAIANQSMFIRVANSVRADPRANSVFITPIEVYSPAIVLACVTSGNSIIDVGAKFTSDDSEAEIISGDLSSQVLLTGPSSLIMSMINSFNGIRTATYTRSGITGKYLFFRFVAISEPALDPKLCNDGNPSNTRIVSINSIGIDLDMKKADVRLSKS